MQLTWADGSRTPVHLTWLRENCPCHHCVDTDTGERTVLLADIPLRLDRAQCTVTDGDLQVTWPGKDRHNSVYSSAWLYRYLCQQETKPQIELWDAGLAENLPVVDGRQITSRHCEEYNLWIDLFCRYGFTIVKNTPVEPGTVDSFARLIGPVRESNFGYLFDVEARAGGGSLAYSSIELKPHTDLSTREYQPGLQFLHCLANNAQGGESTLVDGFHIAEIIRNEHESEFRTLTEIPLAFRNVATQTDFRWTAPVISLDDDGSYNEIRFTFWLRDAMRVPPHVHEKIYTALRLFHKLADSSSNMIVYKMEPGDLLCFDNRRFLHGRKAFQLSCGERLLQGCYGEREDLLSCWRICNRGKQR